MLGPDLPTALGRLPSRVAPGTFLVASVARAAPESSVRDVAGSLVRVAVGEMMAAASETSLEGRAAYLSEEDGVLAARRPTGAWWTEVELEVLGPLLDDRGDLICCDRFSQVVPSTRSPPLRTLAVVGGCAEGKTEVAAALVSAVTAAGVAAGAGKVSGRRTARERLAFRDAGAVAVADFLDFGLPSTRGCPADRLQSTFQAICGGLATAGAEIAVLEVGGGLFDPATFSLLERLPTLVDTAVLAAPPASVAVVARFFDRIGISLAAAVCTPGSTERQAFGGSDDEATAPVPFVAPEQIPAWSAAWLRSEGRR